MRQAFYNVGVYRNDIGACVGLDLGYDGAAEHEHGLREELTHLWCSDPSKNMWVANQPMNPQHIAACVEPNYVAFLIGLDASTRHAYLAPDKSYEATKPISSSWSERGLRVEAHANMVPHVTRILDCIQKGQSTLVYGHLGSFKSSGVAIWDSDAVTLRMKYQWLYSDIQSQALNEVWQSHPLSNVKTYTSQYRIQSLQWLDQAARTIGVMFYDSATQKYEMVSLDDAFSKVQALTQVIQPSP